MRRILIKRNNRNKEEFIKAMTEEQMKSAPGFDSMLLTAKDKVRKREHEDKTKDVLYPGNKTADNTR